MATRSRFPRPDTVRLAISGGDFLIVKRRLTAGEQRAAYQRMYIASLDGTLKVNPLEVGRAMVIAYLVDWSLTDDEGQPVAIRGLSPDALAGTLDLLDHESFVEIRDAVQTHDAAMLAERTQEKKPLNGSGDAVTSPSPSAVTGGSSGFVN